MVKTQTIKNALGQKKGGADNFPLLCDMYGCRGEIKGYKVSVALTHKAALEDCGWADILISKEPTDCKLNKKGGRVIDFFDIWRNGHHAIWLSENKIEIKSVERTRGNRPWTQTVARNKKLRRND